MKKKSAIIKMERGRTAQGLPSNIAASIGRTIARHAFLDYILLNMISTLLHVSIKQTRVAIRLPPASRCAAVIKDLIHFLKLRTSYNFKQFGRKLTEADDARNVLAHAIFIKDPETKKYRIQITRGSWEFPQDVETVSRALYPESPFLDRQFLATKRAVVEVAIREALLLQRHIEAALRGLNEIRRTKPEANRRRTQETDAS